MKTNEHSHFPTPQIFPLLDDLLKKGVDISDLGAIIKLQTPSALHQPGERLAAAQWHTWAGFFPASSLIQSVQHPTEPSRFTAFPKPN